MARRRLRPRLGYVLEVLGLVVALGSPVTSRPALADDLWTQIQQTKEVKVGWAEWAPFEYQDVVSGKLKGLLIDITDEIARRAGVKPVYVQDSWGTLPSAIAAGRANIAILGPTDGRKRMVDFTNPIYGSDFTAIVRKDAQFTDWDSLNKAGNKIAVTTGAAGDEVLTKMQSQGLVAAELVRIKEVGAAILAVSSNKADGYANQRDVLNLMAGRQPTLKVLPGKFGVSDQALAVPKDQRRAQAAFQTIINVMVTDGTMEKLFKQSAIVGAQMYTAH